MKKTLLALIFSTYSLFSFANNIDTSSEKALAIEKIDNITAYYMEELAKGKEETKRLDKIITELEKELIALEATKEIIQVRKDLIKELYVDLEETKDLYLLEFDSNGNIKQEIRDTLVAIKLSLNDDSKIVKIKLSNGKHLPLIKYKVKKNDTLKKILLHTYPDGYQPTWNEVAKRIDTLVKINKNVIKMNYIYPGQTIYIPLFKDNPTENDLKENLINQKKKEMKK